MWTTWRWTVNCISVQLDQTRGFAFSKDEFTGHAHVWNGDSADFLNSASDEAIADVLYLYGEGASPAARAMVTTRPRPLAIWPALSLGMAITMARQKDGHPQFSGHPASM
jgi:16S rRNA C1402 N4-methylase RsmH